MTQESTALLEKRVLLLRQKLKEKEEENQKLLMENEALHTEINYLAHKMCVGTGTDLSKLVKIIKMYDEGMSGFLHEQFGWML